MSAGRGWFLGLAVVLLAGTALAAPTVVLRLVAGVNEGAGVDPGLGDVAGLLQNNLRFGRYSLIATRSLPLPANGAVPLGEGLVAHCVGDQGNLSVTLKMHGRVVVQSAVKLHPGRPLVLGGVPAGTRTLIVVVNLR
mgnify:CR=1 FL=1